MIAGFDYLAETNNCWKKSIPTPALPVRFMGSIGMSSGPADRLLLCRKGPTFSQAHPNSPCPVCSAGNSH